MYFLLTLSILNIHFINSRSVTYFRTFFMKKIEFESIDINSKKLETLSIIKDMNLLSRQKRKYTMFSLTLSWSWSHCVQSQLDTIKSNIHLRDNQPIL